MSETNEILKSMNSITADLVKLGGISKDRKNQQQGYAFRGIDDILNTLAPLVVRHQVVIFPRVLSRTCDVRESTKGSALYFVAVDCEFDFVSARDGSRETVRITGEAMDSADKATNKAISAAMKYACMMAFCIPTEVEDADAEQPDETTPRRADGEVAAPAKVRQPMSQIQRTKLIQLYKATHGNAVTDADALKALDKMFTEAFQHGGKGASYEEAAHMTAQLLAAQRTR